MKIKFVLIFFAFWLISCKETNTEIVKENSEIILKIKEKVEIAPKFENKTSELLYKLEKNKYEINKKINVGGERANNIYEEFRKINDSILSLINSEEDKLLSKDYIGFYSEVTSEVIIPAKYQTKIDKLTNAGLTIKSIGEGYYELQQKPDFYYEIFKNKVSQDYSDFLLLESKDNSVMYSADAGISISFEEVSKRILYWEKFLTNNPYSKLFNKSKENYNTYLRDYLFGMDNTPTYDHKTKLILDETKIELNRFMKENPKSKTCKIIKLFLDNSLELDINGNKYLSQIIEKELINLFKASK